MAFRATNTIPETALTRIKEQAVQIQRLAQNRRNVLAAGNTGADIVLALLDNLIAQQATLDGLSSTVGLAQYAKDQENDQTYDVVVEYNALTAAIDAVVTEIVTTFPTATFLTLNPDGSRSFQQLTPVQTARLRTELDVLIAAIS